MNERLALFVMGNQESDSHHLVLWIIVVVMLLWMNQDYGCREVGKWEPRTERTTPGC